MKPFHTKRQRERVDAIARMMVDKVSDTAIAARLGCRRETVRYCRETWILDKPWPDDNERMRSAKAYLAAREKEDWNARTAGNAKSRTCGRYFTRERRYCGKRASGNYCTSCATDLAAPVAMMSGSREQFA